MCAEQNALIQIYIICSDLFFFFFFLFFLFFYIFGVQFLGVN